jgi:hypothetical protein
MIVAHKKSTEFNQMKLTRRLRPVPGPRSSWATGQSLPPGCRSSCSSRFRATEGSSRTNAVAAAD